MTEVLQKREGERLHYLQSSSVHGVISIAKYVSFVNLNEFSSSLTLDSTDGGYLYLWISAATRGTMFKIGSGEAGTTAGRIYAQQP
jgi:other hect domain ubiquitin protein ligase E3